MELRLYGGHVGVGVRVPVGIAFNLNKLPLDVFLELAPGLGEGLRAGLLGHRRFGLGDTGIAVRLPVVVCSDRNANESAIMAKPLVEFLSNWLQVVGVERAEDTEC